MGSAVPMVEWNGARHSGRTRLTLLGWVTEWFRAFDGGVVGMHPGNAYTGCFSPRETARIEKPLQKYIFSYPLKSFFENGDLIFENKRKAAIPIAPLLEDFPRCFFEQSTRLLCFSFGC